MTQLRKRLTFPCFLQKMFSYIKEKILLLSRLRLAGLVANWILILQELMGRLGCVRSGLAGVSLQGNGVQLLFPVPFPSLRGFAGSRMVHPGCPRLLSRASSGTVGSFNWLRITHLPTSCCLQLPQAGGFTECLTGHFSSDSAPGSALDLAPDLPFQRCWDARRALTIPSSREGTEWTPAQGSRYQLTQESHRNVNPEVQPHLHCFSLHRSFYSSGSNKNFNNSEVKIKFLILHLFFSQVISPWVQDLCLSLRKMTT